jgi:glutamine amidotransferase
MSQTIAIIDYGSGNLRSAAKAFEHVIVTENLPMRVIVTDVAADVAGADRIVLPGQGAFADCMNGLTNVPGMIGALEDAVLEQGRPFFGICVGMQLLATRGLEHGTHQGLGWIEGDVVKMTPSDASLKIPHMGWNTVTCTEAGSSHPVLRSITESADAEGPHFYFVHSFMVESKNTDMMLATGDYGGPVNAIIGRDNIIGTQFHPEKSQEAGLALIRDFLKWKP